MNGARSFFRALYGEDAPGYLPICAPEGDGFVTDWIPATDLRQASKVAVNKAQSKDVYFGLGLHPEGLERSKRGKAEDVIAIPGFWADLDVKGAAHKGDNLPPTGKDALKILDAVPFSPTLILHSGHGLQVWWLFKDLWVFESGGERERARDLSRRFQAMLKAKAKEHDWRMDGTHDISRVLRMPETYNRKIEPVEVRVLRHNEHNRYTPQDFEPYLLELAPEEGHEVNFQENGHDPEGANALLELVRGRLSGRILKTIERGPDHFEPKPGRDGSRSGADGAVCCALIAVGLTDTQIRNVYKTYPIGTRGKYAERGDGYLAHTLGNERAWFNENGKPQVEDEAEPGEKEERRNQADRLIRYALEDVEEFFVDQHGAPHALVGGEPVPLNSRCYSWLRKLVWEQEKKAVNGEYLKTAAGTLAAHAEFSGEVRELHTRAAWHEGTL